MIKNHCKKIGQKARPQESKATLAITNANKMCSNKCEGAINGQKARKAKTFLEKVHNLSKKARWLFARRLCQWNSQKNTCASLIEQSSELSLNLLLSRYSLSSKTLFRAMTFSAGQTVCTGCNAIFHSNESKDPILFFCGA